MLHRSTKLLGITVLTTLCTLAFARPSAAGGTPEQQCEASKLKASGKKAACRLTGMAKIATGGTADLTKCSTKFSDAFTKAETKAGVGVCPTEGDASAIETTIDADTNALQAKLAGMRFVDNGDGTVTDQQTGLQWEKKQNLDSIQNLADPHDADNRYTWSATPLVPDGTVFTQFLATLNTPPCFAGHCDWRLPTEEGQNVPYGATELESILLAPYPCGTNPCIDPIFGPTAAGAYWSATTNAFFPSNAWFVNFPNGLVDYDYKDSDHYARGVRTGP